MITKLFNTAYGLELTICEPKAQQRLNLAVVLVDFLDKKRSSCSVNSISAEEQDKIRSNILFFTNGNVAIDQISVLGPYKIRYESKFLGCQYSQIISRAKSRYLEEIDNSTNYVPVYLIPQDVCWFSSLASFKNQWGISAKCLEPIYHVIGHLLGADHEVGAMDSSMSLDLTTSLQLPFNGAQKVKMGYFSPCEIPADRDSSVQLAPVDTPNKCTTKCQVAVFKGKKNFWYFSFRYPYSSVNLNQERLANSFFMSQLNIHRSKSNTTKGDTKLRYLLAPGEEFTHPDLGNFTITAERDQQNLLLRASSVLNGFLPSVVVEKSTFCDKSVTYTPDCSRFQISSLAMQLQPLIYSSLFITAFLHFQIL